MINQLTNAVIPTWKAVWSPDSAPSDYQLLSKLKSDLRGKN
ncbi:unnamed protein product [Tenebrio molitor]|nr:unnamed protein product [Tenebrio molitor]